MKPKDICDWRRRSSGRPHILASLKSLLETGESLEETREWPREV
jgi:hypothetical protein